MWKLPVGVSEDDSLFMSKDFERSLVERNRLIHLILINKLLTFAFAFFMSYKGNSLKKKKHLLHPYVELANLMCNILNSMRSVSDATRIIRVSIPITNKKYHYLSWFQGRRINFKLHSIRVMLVVWVPKICVYLYLQVLSMMPLNRGYLFFLVRLSSWKNERNKYWWKRKRTKIKKK